MHSITGKKVYYSISAFPSLRGPSKFRARVCVFFTRPTIATAKIRDYILAVCSPNFRSNQLNRYPRLQIIKLTYCKSDQNDENLYPIAILSHLSHPQNKKRSGNEICRKSPDSLPQYEIFDFQICRFPYHESSHDFCYLVVAIATMRYCNGVKRIPEHILVVIFVSSREDSLMFARL